MPAQKRSAEPIVASNSVEDDDPLLLDLGNNHEQQRRGKTEDADDDDDEDYESDRSPSPCNEQKQEYVLVKLSDIRKEVQCPICLGIIRKTRTVMECLHRFCRGCIDKSMRMGNNECPACRTHCASRRSLRDDPNYDALISALYPDIDKYEEEELAFNEDEKTRNKQIQVSIAQTLHRQSEALGRKRMVKGATTAIISRSQSRYRGKRKYRASEPQESDNIEDANGDGSRNSSSADEQHTEVKPKISKRWVQFSSHPTSATSVDGDGDENDSEVNREPLGVSGALVWPSDRLHWGAGGIRSSTRHGNGGNGKNSRSSRLSKLVNYLQNLEKENELDIHLMLVSVDEQRAPSLQRPYLCCRPTLLIKHLCEYVALQTDLQASEIEMYLVKEFYSRINISNSMTTKPSFTNSVRNKDNLQVLKDEETLARLVMQNSSSNGYLLLAYQKK